MYSIFALNLTLCFDVKCESKCVEILTINLVSALIISSTPTHICHSLRHLFVIVLFDTSEYHVLEYYEQISLFRIVPFT